MKRLRITVEGKSYDVTVEVLGDTGAPMPAVPLVTATPSGPVATPAAAPATAPSGEGASIVSQLAGTVVSIAVEAGQSVNAGDILLVIEAMKMNTSIVAPRAGTVTSVAVAAGAVVEEGQTLVTLG